MAQCQLAPFWEKKSVIFFCDFTRQASKNSTGPIGTHVDLLLESLDILDKKDPRVRIIVYDLGMDPNLQRPRVQVRSMT